MDTKWNRLFSMCHKYFSAETCKKELKTDYPGNDITSFIVEHVNQCEQACIKEERCVGMNIEQYHYLFVCLYVAKCKFRILWV